jgi:hypothetical protein
MVAQIADEHIPCPFLIHMLFFAKQGKDTQETG